MQLKQMQEAANQTENCNPPKEKTVKMIEEVKKIPARQIILDIILLYTCALGFELLCQLVGPVERGFFCNDESIRYPYRSGTVTGNALFLYCFNVVLITVLLVEWYRISKVDDDQDHYSSYESGRSKINRLVVRTFIFYGYFQIAFGLAYILTDLSKVSVGRLRPHFLAVCQPNVNLTACMNSNVFINEYKCLGPNPSKVREARLSFFSGHSSLSMVSSTFAVLYLQCRLHNLLPSKVLLPLLQMAIMGMGMFISFSRVYDNMHHWSDVAVGMTVGIVTAILVASHVAKLFELKNREPVTVEERSTTSTIASNNDLAV